MMTMREKNPSCTINHPAVYWRRIQMHDTLESVALRGNEGTDTRLDFKFGNSVICKNLTVHN